MQRVTIKTAWAQEAKQQSL